MLIEKIIRFNRQMIIYIKNIKVNIKTNAL